MIIKIHDVETNLIDERDMTNDELAAYELNNEAIAAFQANQAAKEAARQALLDKLGITADEAKLLLG